MVSLKSCAIVVTYNRKELLKECLTSLLNQSIKLDEVIVIDNASTDDTPKMVKENFPSTTLIALNENLGGAGGFYEGLNYVKDKNYEWVWILDDDTIPDIDSLEMLLETYEKFPNELKPSLLASRVNWTDGTLHPMNLPSVNTKNYENMFLASEYQSVSIRSTSFVSLLINKKMIDTYGLPIKEYFIWNDDLEYSARILKKEFGVCVPSSIVTHKTKSKYTPIESSGKRYYYEVRNKLWVLKTKSFTGTERMKIFLSLMLGLLKYIKINRFSLTSINTVLKGIFDGVFKYKKHPLN